MIQQLQAIQEQKTKNKNSLNKLKNSYLCAIYGGLIKGKSAKQIHSDLYDLTINKKVIDGVMFSNATKIAKKLDNKIANKKGLEQMDIAILVFSLMEEMKADKVLKQNIYSITNNIEGKSKETTIKQELAKNEKESKVFYLASSHKDCAVDHQEAQGRMFIDANWKETIKDKELKSKIASYVKQHKVQTVQYITHAPVWFITRPNCRHYFKALDNESVLKYSASELTRRHKLHRAIGDRQYLQTIAQNKSRKIIGEERNAELVIEKYKERLETHQELYKTFKSSLVREAINKDKLLINKWTEYLNKLQNR